jgi:signal transduction histidine kinase
MITARPGAPEASALAAHDALLGAGLARRHYPARCTVLHENPWLGLQGVAALEGRPSAEIDEIVEIPPGVMAYRGSASEPQARVLRFSFTHAETRYEVGYRYLDYRRFLHRGALPLAGLMVGTTAGVLLAFPHFFHVSLVAPLMGLLAGLNRVNRGERHVHVPVRAEDEIGEMTHAFNRMVGSLRASEAQLGALNLTLEQRVVDRTRDLVTLYEMSAMINRAESLPALLEEVLGRVVPAVDGSAGIILLAAEEDGRLTLAASSGMALGWRDALQGSPLWQQVCERRDALLIHDLVADGALASRVADPRCATLVGVPIPGQTGCLGVLAIFGDVAYLFNVEDLGLLGAVAEQLGVAVENTRLRQRAAAALVVEERQRLARDLHDSVTQLLYSQTLFAEGAALSLQQGHLARTAHCVTRLGETTRRALREMRLMIYRLRPAELAELGLVGVLQRRLERVERRAGVRASLISEGVGCLSPVQEEALYYCAEEALNNALKHANASNVWVELSRGDRSLLLSVRDDGCGFDPDQSPAGFGLQNLRERAAGLGGTFVVQSSPGAGTRITVCLPEDADETPVSEELFYA